MLDATKKMASRNVTPGPDGVPGRIWAETMVIMAPRLRHLFTRCLREGVYPRIWCMARLVLLVLPEVAGAYEGLLREKSTQSGIHGNVFVVAVCYVA